MRDKSNQTKTPSRPTELLRQCQNLLTKHLLDQVTPVVDSTREALYSMAEKAGSTQLQNHMQDGARQLRNQQTLFTTELSQAVADLFTDFRDGASEFHISEPEPVTDYDDDDLQLVEEHELEESLAISDLVAKAEVRFMQSIYALNQRLAVLNRGRPVRSDTNPCGPMQVAHALKVAGRSIDLAAEHRVILFRRFDDSLQEELGNVYLKLNDMLAEAGILPNIKFDTPKRRKSDRTNGSAKSQPEQEPEGPKADFFGRAVEEIRGQPEPEQNSSSQLLSSLRNLLQARRPAQPIKPQAIAPADQLQEIVNQLRLQQAPGQASGQASGQAPQQPAATQQQATEQQAPAEPQAYNADQLRDLLQQHLGQDPSTGQDYQLSHRQNQTVDIVGMLYEFVQQEIALHRRVQSMLTKLQMPMLQVALKEDSFFEDRDHPARKFFNTIADAGELWMEDDGERSPMLQKIEKIIERAANEPQGDGEVFGELLGDVNKQVETLNRRAQLSEKRNVEAAKGRERLDTARSRASKLVDELARRYQPPALVESLLQEAWTDYLALVVLRHGDESEQWSDGVKAAKTLTVSVRNDLEETLRVKINQRLPWLREQLASGLAQVGYFQADINQIISDLEECQGWALTPEQASPAIRPPESLSRRAPSNKKTKPAPTPAITQPRVRQPEAETPPEPETTSEAIGQRAKTEQPAETTSEPTASNVTQLRMPAREPKEITEQPTPEPSEDQVQESKPEPAKVSTPDANEESSTPAPTTIETAAEPAEPPTVEQAEEPSSAAESQSEPETASASGSKIEQMLSNAASVVETPHPEAPTTAEPEPELVLTEDDLSTKERAWLAKLRIVPFGTWFEIQRSDGSWVKRKLSWYSPVTGRCLFVNNRGARAKDILMEALARDMADNRARLYRPDSKPLMDRALEWMFGKLRRDDSNKTTS